MATFAMCTHPGCPVKAHCQRHAASGTRKGPFQRFEDFGKPNAKGECSGLMRVHPKPAPAQEARP